MSQPLKLISEESDFLLEYEAEQGIDGYDEVVAEYVSYVGDEGLCFQVAVVRKRTPNQVVWIVLHSHIRGK